MFDHIKTEAPITPVAAPAPVIVRSNFDDESVWVKSPAYEAPLSPDEIKAVQDEIDSIVGLTRGNLSIAKLVWSGDVRYWKQFHTHWEPNGREIGEPEKRPILQYKNVFDANDVFKFYAFPPRFMILTRLEPEQYADTWARDSRMWCPERQVFIQVQPREAPKEKYLWRQTIAIHAAGCCQRAATNDLDTCYGKYAHPRQVLDSLRQDRRGMEEAGIWDSHPFDSPDRIAQRMRDNMTNNYAEQTMRDFRAQAARNIEETPLLLAPAEMIGKADSFGDLQKRLKEAGKREEDNLEKDLREKERA